MLPLGFISFEAHYECKWCKRQAIVTSKDGHYDGRQLEGWKTFDYSYGHLLDLCSSDCERERDIAYAAAYANVEPMPRGSFSEPPGFREEFERLRLEAMKNRGIDG